MPPSLQRSATWAILGKGSYAACQWAALLVLARLGGVAAVGRFSLALAVTAPIVLLFNLSLRNIQATDAEGQFTHADYVAVRAGTTALALLVIAAIAGSGAYPGETAAVLALVGLAKAFESQGDIVQGLATVHHRLDLAAWSTLLRGLAGLAGLALGSWLMGHLTGGVAAMTAAWAAVYLFHDIPVERRLLAAGAPQTAPGTPLARRLRLVRLALPMGAVALLIAFGTNVPRYFIEARLGEAELGIYAAMASFTVIGAFVINGVGQAALVDLAAHHAHGRRAAFRRILGRLAGVSLVLGLAGVAVSGIAGRELLALAFGEVFAREDRVFLWVTVAGAIGYAATALFYGITARRIFGGQAIVFSLVTLVHAGACALLIGPHGLLGAAWANIAALVVQILLSVWLIRR
jgi:O-antigen/teichoic acid export membrane protein